MDSSDYDSIDPGGPGEDGRDSWNDVDQLLEELEQSKEEQQEILKGLIEDIESELERVHDVYSENVSALKDSISGQQNRLEVAQSGAGLEEETIRSRLAQLYEELRRERREELDNRLELLMRKWDLERELEELNDSGVHLK